MPRVSVVVPIYNVEPYLAECLQSIARQTVADLEVVMVDDGSTDGGARIAARFAAHDDRFRLLRQANRGLGAARNRGVAAARGEYLAFVDSDDVLPPDAYAHLLGALEQTGSDFATGAVRRLQDGALVPAQWLAETHARTRLRTHVSRFEPLIADRTAWNKLWRRTFWDDHALRFPEGVWHEDIPVVVPAQFRAAAVDVVAHPVYHWRQRCDSITQRRLAPDVLEDRLDAVGAVLAFLDGSEAADRYRRRLVRDDLRLHLELLDLADDAYRRRFLGRAMALLEGEPERFVDGLPAIDRLKWHLAGRGLLDELVAVCAFHRDAWPATPVRRHGRWFGGYPFRGELDIPWSVFRLGRADTDLALDVHLDGMRIDDDGALQLDGHGAIAGLGAAGRSDQRLKIALLPPGRWGQVRARAGALTLPVHAVRRRDLPAREGWSGFSARLDPGVLASAAARGSSELCAIVSARGVRRRRTRFVLSSPDLLRPHVLAAADGGLVEVAVTADGRVRLRRRGAHATLHTFAKGEDGVLAIVGAVTLATGAAPRLEVRRTSDGHTLTVDMALADARDAFRARVPLTALGAATASAQRIAAGPATVETWALELVCDDTRLALEFPADVPERTYATADLELSLRRTADGRAVLLERQRTGVLAPVARRDAATA